MSDNITLLQNCITDRHFEQVQSGFTPLDFRHNPAPELREFQIFRELYASGAHKKTDLLGAVSTRFQGKSLLDGNDVRRWIAENPGYDVYVVNPFPQFAYTHKNLWQFSESTRDPNFTAKSQAVFDKAGIDFDLANAGHHNNSILSACSYWFGNAGFWQAYMDEVINPVLDLTRDQLGPELHDFLYTHQDYYGVATHGCGSLPFVLERTVSLFLANRPGIKRLFYPADRARTLACCLFPFERDLVRLFGDKIDQWDREQYTGPDMEDYFRMSSMMCGNGWRLYFKFHPISFEGDNPRAHAPWFNQLGT